MCSRSQTSIKSNEQGKTSFRICHSRHTGQFIHHPPRCICLLLDVCVVTKSVLQFADWLEFYAQTLELNVWTSALVEKMGKGEKGQWNVTVRRGGPDGTVRILHPTHVVIASGLSGEARIPHFQGKVWRSVVW